MKKCKIAFYDAKPYDEDFFTTSNSQFNFNLKFLKNHLNSDTADLSKGYDVVCAFVNDTLDQATIEVLKRNGIQLIALRCAGYNNVDLKAVYGNIHVVRVPDYSPYAVAEHAVALMMSLNRKTHKAYYRTRDGNFAITGLLGFDMHGKTAGIIGTGKIGKCVINILKGLGMNILAYDAYPDIDLVKSDKISYESLKIIYQKADIITLHCPLSKETEYMINHESINLMKDGVMIINTGRGKLIQTKALIDGLKSGKIGSAGLDVYEEESDYFFEDFSYTMISDDVLARLMTFSNVLITSHQGFFTKEALTNIALTTLNNVQEYFNGDFLKNEICYRCNNSCVKKEGKRCF
jgi:D-lactate dehydrogenase